MEKRIFIFHDNLILETAQELAKERGIKFASEPRSLSHYNEWNSIQCELVTEDMWAGFQLQQMPGCCAILTLSYVRVQSHSQENFDYVVKFVEEAAYAAGFGSVVMTQVVPAFTKYLWKDEPWFLSLSRKWKASDPFRNAKSGNLCIYLTKDLLQPGKVKGLERVEKGVHPKGS